MTREKRLGMTKKEGLRMTRSEELAMTGKIASGFMWLTVICVTFAIAVL
jgi:hypothetical protein